MDYSQAYDEAEKSIVNVAQCKDDKYISSASGTIIGKGNYVLTCSHCCDINCLSGIYDKNNDSFIPGELIFNHIDSDIAILKFPSQLGEPLKIKDSSRVKIGNEIYTIGFPYSFHSEKTLTVGHIAAIENGLFKIDVSINNGNSGGPLLNLDGEIIGVVNEKLGGFSKYLQSLKHRTYDAKVIICGVNPLEVMGQMICEMEKNLNLGIGYAIPSNNIARVSEVVREIIST